jgi:hypothetical protein
MADRQWYMAIGGHQVGPVSEEEIAANIRSGGLDASTLVFTTGMTGWTAAKDAPQLSGYFGATPRPSVVPALPGRTAHEIDFEIRGSEMQFVEVILDPGESAVAEAGVLMYMTQGIEMETIFGDGSKQQTGIMDALLGAGRRILTGESLFMTVFTNRASRREVVAFAAPFAGKIVPMDLRALGGELVCQKERKRARSSTPPWVSVA